MISKTPTLSLFDCSVMLTIAELLIEYLMLVAIVSKRRFSRPSKDLLSWVGSEGEAGRRGGRERGLGGQRTTIEDFFS